MKKPLEFRVGDCVIPADFPIPVTSHVRAVFEAAEQVGLEFDKLTGRYFVDGDFSNGANVRFAKGDYYVSVTFDRRGYIVQAGGRSLAGRELVGRVGGSLPALPVLSEARAGGADDLHDAAVREGGGVDGTSSRWSSPGLSSWASRRETSRRSCSSSNQ